MHIKADWGQEHCCPQPRSVGKACRLSPYALRQDDLAFPPLVQPIGSSPNCNGRGGSDSQSSGHAAPNHTPNSGQARCNTGRSQPADGAHRSYRANRPGCTRCSANSSRLCGVFIDVIPLHTDRLFACQ